MFYTSYQKIQYHLYTIAMANSYHQIHLHCVFAVKCRQALIKKSWGHIIHAHIADCINDFGCKSIIVNGVEDHVHSLFGLHPVVRITELIQMIKGTSSRLINNQQLTTHKFSWQVGYGIFSHSKNEVDRIYNYIKNQEQHHATRSFRNEYSHLLKEFDSSVNPEYLFHQPI